jgi:uncharacterized protein DUF2834
MPETRFDWVLIALGLAFVVTIGIVLVPTFLDDGLDLGHAFAQALVNPYASGFAIDLLFTYAVLFAWVVYEYQYRDVQHGWVALVLGFLIGVSVGFVAYLLIRHREIGPQTWRR